MKNQPGLLMFGAFCILIVMLLFAVDSKQKMYYTHFQYVTDSVTDDYVGQYLIEFDKFGLYITDTTGMLVQFNQIGSIYQEESRSEQYELITDDYTLTLKGTNNPYELHFSGVTYK